MTLYEQWQDLIENQTDATFKEFWDTYSSTETKIYSSILDTPEEKIEGIFSDLVKKYDADPIIYMGFLDGISSSLNNDLKFETFDENSNLILDINYEKLYFNMLDAKADYLYSLPQWQDILSDEKREEITKRYKKSKIVVKEKEPGRNDPCPCGSGKKYKKCCGANK